MYPLYMQPVALSRGKFSIFQILQKLGKPLLARLFLISKIGKRVTTRNEDLLWRPWRVGITGYNPSPTRFKRGPSAGVAYSFMDSRENLMVLQRR